MTAPAQRRGGRGRGTRAMFSPSATGDEVANKAAGQVTIISRVPEEEGTPKGCSPLYRVKNLQNGVETYAFGDELA